MVIYSPAVYSIRVGAKLSFAHAKFNKQESTNALVLRGVESRRDGLYRLEVRIIVYTVQAAVTRSTKETDDRRMDFIERRHLANKSLLYCTLETRQVLA